MCSGYAEYGRWLASVLLLALLAGCSDPLSPEARVRETLDRAEQAIEARSLSDAKALLAETFRDSDGRERATVMRLLAGYFLQHPSIHLLVQVQRIDFPAPELAEVTLYAAMAGREINDPGQLTALRASLYRFDLQLRDIDGEWRLVGGAWRPASGRDFME